MNSYLRRLIKVLSLILGLVTFCDARAQQTTADQTFVVKPRLGHTDGIYNIAISPDGALLASEADDGFLYVWDVATGTVIRSFSGMPLAGAPVAISPDNRFLVSVVRKRGVTVWDLRSGTLLRELPEATDRVHTIAFSADGTIMLTDGTLWNTATWTQVRKLHVDVGSAAFTQNETLVVRRKAEVEFINSATAQSMRTLSLQDPHPLPARLFTNSTKFAIASDESWVVVPLNGDGSGDAEERPPGSEPDMIVVVDAHSGKIIRTLTGYADLAIDTSSVTAFAISSVRVLAGYFGIGRHTEPVTALALSPDGKFIVSGGEDSTTRLWNTQTGQLVWSAKNKFMVQAVAYSPKGDWVAITRDISDIDILDVHDGKLIKRLGRPQRPVNAVAISSDSTKIAVAIDANAVLLWDLRAAQLIETLPQQGIPDSIAYSPDGASLVVGNRGNTISMWDAQTPHLARSFKGGEGNVNSVAPSPDGKQIAVGGSTDTSVRIWDVATGRLVRKLAGLKIGSNTVAFSPDGKSLVAGGGVEELGGGMIQTWDLASGRAVHTREGTRVRAAVFSPDNSIFATADLGEITLWKSGSAEMVRTITPTVDPSMAPTIRSLAFSPDGELLASGSQDDYKVRIWDTASGRLVRTLNGHVGWVNSIAFTPDGARIVTAGSDGLVNIWHAETGELLVTMAATADAEWLIITPEGFFAASAKGTKLLQIVRGTVAYSVDQFYQSLYRPDLVRQKLAGDRDGKVKEAALKLDLDKVLKSGAAPRLTISSPSNNSNQSDDRVTIDVRVGEQGGGIGRVEWRVNGVTIGVQNHNSVVPSADQDTIIQRSVVLGEGPNVVEVIAYNAQNLIASLPASIVVTTAPTTIRPRPRLYVLALGISDYLDQTLKLKFADRDATAISAVFQKPDIGTGLYESVHVRTLLDGEVTRQGIDAAIEELSKIIRPQDVFVLYVVGHGVTEDGRYYFIPHEFHDDGNDAIVKTAIGQDQLQNWLARISALRSVLIYDTCESGSAAEDHSGFREPQRLVAVEKSSCALAGRTVLALTDYIARQRRGLQGTRPFHICGT